MFYEPLAEVAPSLAALLAGPPLRKMIFVEDEETVAGALRPYWSRALEGKGADVTQAVPDMLEVSPNPCPKIC